MHDAPILRVVRLKGTNMITHNTLSFVILRGSYSSSSNFQWRGLEGKKKKKRVKAQIQSSQAAEFSSKAGNRWTGTAAEGAATSLEKTTQACAASRSVSTALPFCAGLLLGAGGWMVW